MQLKIYAMLKNQKSDKHRTIHKLKWV